MWKMSETKKPKNQKTKKIQKKQKKQDCAPQGDGVRCRGLGCAILVFLFFLVFWFFGFLVFWFGWSMHMCQVELQDIVNGCRGVHVEDVSEGLVKSVGGPYSLPLLPFQGLQTCVQLFLALGLWFY